MRIGVIGAGRIGGNAARLFAKAGHEVLVSFSRDPQQARGARGRDRRRAPGTPREAVAVRRGRDALGLLDADRRRPRRRPARSTARSSSTPPTSSGARAGRTSAGARPRRSTPRGCRARATRRPSTRSPPASRRRRPGAPGPTAWCMFLCGDDEEAKRVVARAHRRRGLHAGRHGRRSPTRRRWRRRGARAPSTARRSMRRRRGSSSRRPAVGMTPTLYEWAGGQEAFDRLTEPSTGASAPTSARAGVRAMPPTTRTTSRCGSARSSAARPLHRGARRLPAHARKHLGLAITEEQRSAGSR